MGGKGNKGADKAARIQAEAATRQQELSSEATRYAADLSAAAQREAMALQREMFGESSTMQRDMFNQSNALNTRMYDEGMDRQQQWYDQTRLDTSAQREMGQSAMQRLGNLLREGGPLTTAFNPTKFEGDKGYQFRLSEGQKVLNNRSAANGRLNSGAGMKEMMSWAQGLASDEYDKAYNRDANDKNMLYNMVSGAANMGAAANNAGVESVAAMQQLGQGYANQTGNLTANRAAQGTALNSGFGNTMSQIGINGANTLGGIHTQGAANQSNIIGNLANFQANAAMSKKESGGFQGALGGAATGFMVGGPWGALIGGVLGFLG